MYKNWGLESLGKHEYEESLDEMRHADKLIDRVLFLEGLPNLQDLGKLHIGETPKEVLECDLRIEMQAHPDLMAAVKSSEEIGDFVSRDLFDSILASEEEHVDYLETHIGYGTIRGEYQRNTISPCRNNSWIYISCQFCNECSGGVRASVYE